MEAFNQAYDEITSVKSFPSVSSSDSCHVINGGMVQKNRIRDIKPLLKISSILEKKPNYVEVFPDEEMRDESEQTKISDLEVSGDSRYLQAHVDEDQSCDQDSLEVEYKTFGNGKVKLTNEERETFVSEGLPLPSGVPLTKAEERALKRIRRKIKNKLSAQESRRKKKEYVEGLEKRAEACNSENSILRQKVDSLESTVRALLTELNRLRKVPLENKNRKRTQMESRGTQTGTCLKCLMRRSAAYRQQNFGRLETLRENNNLPKEPCNRLARFDAHN